MHGGGPDVVAGKPLDHVYKEEALDLVKVGMKFYELCCRIETLTLVYFVVVGWVQ